MFPKLVREGGLDELKPRLRCISMGSYPFQEEGYWHFPCKFARAGHSVLYLQSWEGHQLSKFSVYEKQTVQRKGNRGFYSVHM